MVTCKADPTLERKSVAEFRFPLGAYPVDPMTPKPGYSVAFEPADGGDEEGDAEEWPDRYVFDAVISAERVEPLCRHLFAIFPGRVYPILDVLGHDAYREVDPYIAYDLVGLDRFADGVRRFRDFLYEDGMCGFGAMSEEPFLYVFVDEHKIVTIRAEPTLKEKIEKILKAFDLEACDDPAGADAAAHEHRSVLLIPKDDPSLLGPDEIVEQLRDEWSLLLNVDPDVNTDDQGAPLGATGWRCIVRCEQASKPPRYAEIVLRADSLRRAEELAFDGVEAFAGKESDDFDDVIIIQSDRLRPEQMPPARTKKVKPALPEGVLVTRWLD